MCVFATLKAQPSPDTFESNQAAYDPFRGFVMFSYTKHKESLRNVTSAKTK